MYRTGLLIGSFLLVATAAQAEQHGPGGGGYALKPLVTPQQAVAEPARPAPYAMNYSEEVARRLNVQDGGLGLLPRAENNPYAPSVSFNGSMLRLRWRP